MGTGLCMGAAIAGGGMASGMAITSGGAGAPASLTQLASSRQLTQRPPRPHTAFFGSRQSSLLAHCTQTPSSALQCSSGPVQAVCSEHSGAQVLSTLLQA